MKSKSRYKYFAISDRDKRWGLFVLNCGESLVEAHDIFPPSNHPIHHYFEWRRGRILQEYQMFYLLEGEGLFESEAIGRRIISAGELVLLFPNRWHRYKPLDYSNWHTYWTGFDGSFARNLEDQQFFTADDPIIRIGYREQIVRSFTDIISTGYDEHAGYQQVMAGQVMKILGQIRGHQQRRKFQDNNMEEIIGRARILLTESIDKRIAMEDIAEHLGLGYSLFRNLFKQVTGMAPCQYLIQLRIEKAKELLCLPDRSIKQIAALTGFTSAYYFARLFKEKTGLSPSHYRNRVLGGFDETVSSRIKAETIFTTQ